MAAPGTPKACVTPSRSRMATAASAAVMRAMSALLCGVAAVRPGTGQFGDELQQAGVVEAAVAAGDQRAHQLDDHRAERDRDPCLAGRRRDDAEVLVVQGEPEARLELTVEHVRALAVEHGAAGQAAAEYFQRSLRVDAVRLEEHDRLGEDLDVDGDDELVRGLDGLARPGGADVHDRLADGLQYGPRVFEVAGLAAHH